MDGWVAWYSKMPFFKPIFFFGSLSHEPIANLYSLLEAVDDIGAAKSYNGVLSCFLKSYTGFPCGVQKTWQPLSPSQ
jgi:hypothetical protein